MNGAWRRRTCRGLRRDWRAADTPIDGLRVQRGWGTARTRRTSRSAPPPAYGRTKLAGEQAVLAALAGRRATCVSTAWLYGAHGPQLHPGR